MKKSKKKRKKMLESKTNEITLSFRSAIEAISAIFRRCSIEDVAKSIFISNTWLPNIASPIKHQFFIAIFATLKPEEFLSSNSINSYEDFRNFIKKVYELSPSFVLLEDYVPEPDWGEVKFHHAGQNYKMFYGNELSNVHEYLALFQMLYVTFEDEYLTYAGRSPAEELRCCLQLQQQVINGITGQPTKEAIPHLSPGHLEIPPKSFWEEAQAFYSTFRPEKIVPKSFLRTYSIRLGILPVESLASEVFGESVFRGTFLPSFFITHESRYFPVLPRRYSSILFDSWTRVFRDHNEKIDSDRTRCSVRMGAELHKYVNKRLITENKFPFASAVTKEGKPHEIVFPTVFISKNKLVLAYLTHPASSGQKIGEELANAVPKLNEALKLIEFQPTTLALHMDRKNVQFQSKSTKESLKPELLILIPQASTQIESFSIPKTLPGKIAFLDSFLGIIDELEDVDSLADFLEYLDEIDEHIQPMLSMLDKFASYKDSHGLLVGGALEPDFIMLDPHWGSSMRYRSLAEFWGLYPEVDFFDHPRTWKVKKETATSVRLEARGYFGCALHCQVGSTHVYITAPFREMSFEQGKLSNFMMECLEDSISRRKSIFKEHKFFKNYDRFEAIFFPVSLVSENKKFEHLKHLCCFNEYWCSDYGFPDPDFCGIRVVFNDKLIVQAFSEAKDCSLEVDILLEVLKQLNKITPDPEITLINDILEKTKAGRPRFKLFEAEKPASFPELVNPCEPRPHHFKRAKKCIAQLASKQNLSEGYYELEDAKQKLNGLRDSIVSEINSEITKYNFANAIPFLLARIDALNARYERKRFTVEYGLQHETDYEPEVRYAEQQTEYIRMHKNYRYLIEKFVQLEPQGQMNLNKDQFQYLIALIDWLHVFYTASDTLHYGILPLGIKLDRDYLVEVQYEGDVASKEKVFSEEMAKLDLALVGNIEDRVNSPRPVEEFLDELDRASIKDLGFSFRSMVNVLQILTHWPAYRSNIKESASYSAEFDEIEEICIRNIKGIWREEIKPVIEFLTLKKEDVVRILEQDEPCQDLPVWEHRKRYSRYNIRPLILIDNEYHWGPYSTRKSGIIWSGTPSTGTLPTDPQCPRIVDVLKTEKKLVEDALVEKALEVVKRYTPHARMNCKLHQLGPKGYHPADLGDYDVLAFYPVKNVVLNIECKDILPVHCLKDAKRLREKIFGRPDKNEGHFEQINKRQSYLSNCLPEIASALEWPIDSENPPKIITVYLSRRSYWWTRFPPKEIDAVFLRIDLLSKFINDLEN